MGRRLVMYVGVPGAVVVAAVLAVALGVAYSVNTTSHPLIAVAYFALASIFAVVRLGTPTETALARVGAVLFFTGCGLHHMDMLGHAIPETAIDFDSFHHTVASVMQVVGAPLFLLAVGPYTYDLFYLLRHPRLIRQVRVEAQANGIHE